ncbi:MAG: glycoside hydrolase family 88 protein [Bacteroidota bacterium]
MKYSLYLALLMGLFLSCSTQKNTTNETTFSPDKQLNLLTQKALENTKIIPLDSMRVPRSVKEDGSLHGVKTRDWTSGFYAGTFWGLYRHSQNENLKKAAMDWTAFQRKERFDDHTHDLGFKIYCSFGEGFRQMKNADYKQVIIDASEQLIQRYSDKVGAIRSWDHNRDKWDYPVIIDNMMNLEMLFVASKLSGNPKYYEIADKHAQKTLKNHFRPDNSSYHVIDYFPETGEVRKRNTHQGHSHESAWARGQAWGLYGFTVAYRETKNPAYLEQAKKIANFFFTHPNLPADKIPYWDFNAPNIPNEERDASAAAIAVSGLIELSQYDPANSDKYLGWIDQVLAALSSEPYQATTPPFFVSQCVGSKPHDSEVNVPINYADYYFVEALLRRKALLEDGDLTGIIAG